MSLLTFLALVTAQTACPAGAEPIPAALSGWTRAATGAVVASAGADTAPVITLGAAASLALHPAEHVRLAVPLRRATMGASHAGYLAIDVARPGTYRVALSDRGWIELLKDGKPVASITHGHGPRCSGIRKIVDFPLSAGRHVLQINGNPTEQLRVMVAAAD